MRIVVITSWPTDVIAGSGTAVFFNALTGGLQDHGYEVEIIAPNFDTSNYVEATLRRFLFNTDLTTDPRVRRADVIIGFDYDGYGLDPANRPPMITSAAAVYGDVIRWESEPFRTMVEAQAFFDRVAMQRADRVTTGSEYAKDRIVRLYGIDPGKITVVRYGMLDRPWLPLVDAEPRQPTDHPVILSVGKMYPRKRTDILLHALAMLRPVYPAIELRVVGDGLEWDRLHRIAEALKISEHVTWLGHLDDDPAFAREWRQADIFCHPSSQETFGYVYLEAMTLGKAIVAVRAGSAPEVLDDAALLAEPEDPAALADQLRRFLDDESRRQQYGQRARTRAPLYTVRHMIDDYTKVIRELVG